MNQLTNQLIRIIVRCLGGELESSSKTRELEVFEN